MIEGGGELQNPRTRDSVVTGLEAHHAAEGGGPADGADGLGADGQGAQLGSDSCRGAAGRASRGVGWDDRVASRPGSEIGELRGDGLAENQGPCLPQAPNALGLVALELSRGQAAAGAGEKPFGLKDILDADRHAEELWALLREGGIERPRFVPLAVASRSGRPPARRPESASRDGESAARARTDKSRFPTHRCAGPR